MTAALFLGQHVNLTHVVGVRMDGARLGQNLTTLDLVALDAAEQHADVVASLGLIQQLAEHFHAGDDGAARLILQADDLDGIGNLHHTALNTAGRNGAAAGDGEHVLNRHQERLVGVALRGRDVLIDSVHQLEDALALRRILRIGAAVLDILQSLQRGTADDRDLVAREAVGAQQLANLHLDQLKQLFVVHHIGLVQEDNDVVNADLTGQQDVLTGLRHRAVRSRHDQDRAVHLGSAGDHVLHVVGVAGAVNVSIVTLLGLILDVRGVDRDAARLLFRRLVDLVVTHGLRLAEGGQHHRDGSGQGRFAVVNVADGANVNVRLRALKLLLSHFLFPPCVRPKPDIL